MAACPRCLVSYPPSVLTCPADGSMLAVVATTAQGGHGLDSPTDPRQAITDTEAPVIPAPGTDPPQAGAGTGLATGSMVGEYRITGKLGEGGMGTVYAGEHPVIGKKVAVKVINAALSQDESMVQRFIQEARAVNQIGHRSIVDIFAFGQLPSGRHYFVMELLPGKSLKDRIEQQPPLPTEEIFAILLDVCSALVAAHAAGIVHRDLKPDNVFLVETKSGERAVKLLDFGIAKLLRRDETLHRTRSGVPMGTPYYMSPEQGEGRPVDARTDVYALGVMMFELFCGRRPFEGLSYVATITAHLSQQPPAPSQFVEIPAELEAVILACLEKDVALRPQTIDEVRQRLTEIAPQMGSALERRQGPASAFVTPLPPLVRPISQPDPEPPAGRRSAGLYVAVAALVLGVGAVALWLGGRRGGDTTPPPPPTAAAEIDLQVLSEPSGATVLINGEKQTLRTPNTFKVRRAASLKVTLEKEGWKPYEEVVSIAPAVTQKVVQANLLALNLAPGRLRISTPVKKAAFRLDGQPVGDGSGALVVEALTAGEHTVDVEAKGFQRRQERILIRPSEGTALEWNLTAARAPTKAKPEKSDKREDKPTTPEPPLDVNRTSGWPPN